MEAGSYIFSQAILINSENFEPKENDDRVVMHKLSMGAKKKKTYFFYKRVNKSRFKS